MRTVLTNNELNDFSIVPAKLEDVFDISELTKGENLRYRPEEEVTVNLKNFFVLKHKQVGLIGCIGSKTYEDADVEIISLRIKEKFCGNGLGFGKKLLRKKLESLAGVKGRIFALTTPERAEITFLPMGFIKAGILMFGEKIKADCLDCKKNVMENGIYKCNEIAVLYKKPPVS